MNSSRLLLIGVGNRYRRDDGVGLFIADLLLEHDHPDMSILKLSGEGASLMDAWEGASELILFDAVSPQGKPGTVHRFDARKDQLKRALFSCSTHDFGVAEAVEMSRALGCLPSSFIIYGIEGADFGDGIGLTPQVEHAAKELCRRVRSRQQEHDAELWMSRKQSEPDFGEFSSSELSVEDSRAKVQARAHEYTNTALGIRQCMSFHLLTTC